jgi:tRNA-modifying protein YgfZ
MCPCETSDPHQLREDVVRVDLGGLAVLRGTGADRMGFLHRLTTGSVQGTSVGAGCFSLLLDSKGHIMGDLRICVRDEDLRLVMAGAAGQGIVAALTRYAVMDDFALAVEREIAMNALYGPRSAEVLRQAGVGVPAGFEAKPAWSHADADSPWGKLWLVCSHDLGADGIWVFGSSAAASALAATLETASIPILAQQVAEALRIEAGEPRFGHEITGETFPMEVGLAGALDQKKGCYLGQETIVRVRDRGLIRRRLVGLRLAGEGMPAMGDGIAFEQNSSTGRVTSVGQIPGHPAVTLALLATSVPVGAEVQITHDADTLPARVVFDRPPWQ